MENIRSNLITRYINLTKDCPINQLGPPYTFRYGDEISSNILVTNIVEIDIKSAFPIICKILFGENHPFVQNIFKLDDKLQRNIYISTTLKQQSEKDGVAYLNELNLLSKILILSYVYSNFTNITILEFVKDGVIIKAEPFHNNTKDNCELEKIIQEYDIQFHRKKIDTYIRVNKTSILKYNNIEKLKLKGPYNSPPEFILYIFKEFFNGKLYDKPLLYMIKKVYDQLYYNILFKSHLSHDIKKYYQFQDNKFLSANGKVTHNIAEINAFSYLEEFIYPVLSLLRLHYKN